VGLGFIGLSYALIAHRFTRPTHARCKRDPRATKATETTRCNLVRETSLPRCQAKGAGTMTLICSYPVLQVRPYGLLVYEHKEFSSTRQHTQVRPREKISQYTGVLTPFAKKKLKRAIGLMVASAKEKEAPNFKTGKTFKFKVNFITFTLPALQGEVTDKSIKHCLDNWVKRAKRKHKLNSYVWRAERQANGNIHFHMITDVWIHYEKIRNDWNACLRETGLIEKFKEKHGHENPNSTDVHAVWKVRNLTQYFVKYMSKAHKEGEQPIKGKVWDCSANLKTKENCWMLLEGAVSENFDYLARKEDIERINDPLFTILFVPQEKWEQYIGKEIREKWLQYLERIRSSE
jgi:hypothetical protein